MVRQANTPYRSNYPLFGSGYSGLIDIRTTMTLQQLPPATSGEAENGWIPEVSMRKG